MQQKQFEHHFKEYYRPLCLFALNFTGSHEEAEDIVQQFFVEFWERSGVQEVQITHLKSYLYTAVKNRCLKYLQQRAKTLPEEWISDEKADDGEEQIRLVEQEARLWQLIDELPPERRKIFLLAKQEQMKYREIAEKLHLSEKTVENQIGKALKSLREKAKRIYLFFFG